MRMLNNLKQDKGQAGLQILLSVVTMLFIIGLMVMIFSLMGGELEDFSETNVAGGMVQPLGNATYDNVTAVTFANATLLALEDISCTIVNVTNATTTTQVIGTDNYTQSNCLLESTDAGQARCNGGITCNWNVTFTFAYTTDTTASGVIENTTEDIGTVVNWFPLFIVISAMVVLILLTVIIITAIRGSGMIGGGSSGGGTGSA